MVGASACGGGSGGTEAGGTDTGGPIGTTSVAATPTTILNFSAPVIGGGQLHAGDEFAGAPVAFWFWAPT